MSWSLRLSEPIRKLETQYPSSNISKLTIIPQALVGYEMKDSQQMRVAPMAIIISYPTSASGMIALLKTPTNDG